MYATHYWLHYYAIVFLSNMEQMSLANIFICETSLSKLGNRLYELSFNNLFKNLVFVEKQHNSSLKILDYLLLKIYSQPMTDIKFK